MPLLAQSNQKLLRLASCTIIRQTARNKGFAMRMAMTIALTLAVGMCAGLSIASAQRNKPGFNAAHQQCVREFRARFPNGSDQSHAFIRACMAARGFES